MHKKPNPKIAIPVAVVLLALVIYALVRAFSPQGGTTLTGSGTIEADNSVISPELGGRVVDIFVNEGDKVTAGDPLFRIDDTLLQGQLTVANASLEFATSAAATTKAAVTTAQANYDLALAAALIESAGARSQDWQTLNPAGFTLPGGSFTPTDWIAAARDELQSALNASSQAQTDLNKVLANAANGEFVAAETNLLASRARVQTSQDVLTKAGNSNNQALRDSAQEAYDAAVSALEDAQARYDELKETDPAQKVLVARNDLVLAVERVQTARTRLNALFTGENSLKVQVAKATLDQAAAAATQAQQAVSQANANLSLLTLQINKLIVTSPMDGTILSSSIAIGEVLAPGAPAFSVGQLDPLTITVYVPEFQIGLIAIGRSASLTVDSYPGIEFLAEVTHIADQAEYTPRNVQTTEGRKTTVFAVNLQVANPNGQLKPGMPADVVFLP